MQQKVKYIVIILFAATITTCKTPYTPAPVSTVTNYLVVEGMINVTDSTYINLSRTVNISAKTTTKPELKATVTIESSQGGSYPLTELGNGVYAAAPLNLSAANQYRLRIKTSNGNTYASDFTPAIVSPPIDSITWKAKSTSLEIYANTHDPKNATRYYRWDFNEAWEFHPNYRSMLVSDGLHITIRTLAQDIWDCFTGDNSTSISLGTSVKLQQDVINESLINTISSDAEKIGVKYTIGVKQYGLTKDAYDYWTLLKKNTEQLGSIFDSQPSASIGNIHGLTNPAEVVIGYISAGTFTTSRIFITKGQLPNWTTTPFYAQFPTCKADSLDCCVPLPPPPSTNQFVNFKNGAFTGPVEIPITDLHDGGTLAAPPFCVDCTLRGTKIPPAYWK